MMGSLLAINTVAHASSLDTLIQTSGEIVDQIDRGIILTGSAMEYSVQGSGISSGNLSSTAHLTPEQLEAYNMALNDFAENYLPYGSVKTVLEAQAAESLDLMDEAIDTFTAVTVELITVQDVNTRAEEASTPNEEAEVQEFVVQNQEMLTISQEQVDTFNESLDDIETHANEASAYLAVANSEAADFLQQGVENANTTADNVNIFYDANSQAILMGYPMQRHLTIVNLMGENNYGLDLYVSEADVLAAGSESEFYLTGPTALGYNCFMYETDCE